MIVCPVVYRKFFHKKFNYFVIDINPEFHPYKIVKTLTGGRIKINQR